MHSGRREFLKAALAAAVFGTSRGADGADTGAVKRRVLARQSAVIHASSKRCLQGGRLNPDVIKEMLNQSLMRLTFSKDPREAWKCIASSTDRVGIKVNCIGRSSLSTHPEVVWAIVEGLKSAGVKPGEIVVLDREQDELAEADFRSATVGGARVTAITEYSPDLIQFPFGSTRLAKVLEGITALINVPILKDHDMAGVTIGMKNLSHGLCENPADFHDNNCDPAIPTLFGVDAIQNRLQLTVCDAVIGAFEGGPTGMANKQKWACGSLLLSTDTVALDRVGADLIEEQRRLRGLMPLARRGTPPRHILTAGKMGLGHYLPEHIQIVRLNV